MVLGAQRHDLPRSGVRISRVAMAGVLLALLQLDPHEARGQTAPLSTAEIASRSVPATVTVLTIDAHGDTIGQGSGFLLDSPRRVVTNWHVLEGAMSAVVVLPDARRYNQVRFLHGDSLADVAMLEITASDLPTLNACDDEPQVGDAIVAIGSPLGFTGTVSVGIVGATRVEHGVNVLQLSLPLSPGSSGGPILGRDGCVVAVAAAYVEEARHIGFATPIHYVTRLLEEPVSDRPLQDVFGRMRITGVAQAADRPATEDTDVVAGYRAAAQRGEPEAAYQLGLRYAGGLGVPQDHVAAAAWFRHAADQGVGHAQYQLGAMYAVGLGVERDAIEAARWITMAAVRGVADAQHDLGMAYAAGAGVAADPAEAVRWLQQAAAQNHAQAQYCLGAMYRIGRGIARDDTAAAAWYRRAADQGVTEAQHNLGVLYALGEGVPKDLIEAYQWLRLAADAQTGEPSASATRTLAELSQEMRPDQIAEAERRAADWKARSSR